MPVPPTLVRRLVLAPLILALDVVLVLAGPVLLLLAAIASPLYGGWRPVRLVWIVLVFAARHFVATVACLCLWLASGFGRTADRDRLQRAHYAVLRWFIDGIHRAVISAARVEVRVVESSRAEAALSAGGRPAVVLSRHAGEGDSFLILHHLLCRHRRLPRVVMHEALKLDPLIDVLGHRLPNRFVDPRGGDTETEIAAMSRDLDPAGAVLIFPEGGNFSDARRRRGIERLEHAGHDEEAAWARGMSNVSAPRPGGALAALDAAPDADVVFVGHVGFPTSLGDVWRRLTDHQVVELRLWVVGADEIPTEHDARIDWLFAWWRTLDAWVGERRAAPEEFRHSPRAGRRV
jgi:1-acyl-sn-glycerol-3-phosphate acyltransferase